MTGELRISKVATGVRVAVYGNVGDENRAKLTALGMTPAVDIANCRERIVTSAAELDTLRNALVEQGIITKN